MLANFTNLTYSANSSLVFGVILGAVKGTLFVRAATVDGGVTGSTNVKLGKLVELDVDRVIWISLTLSLRFLGLSE